LRDDNHDVARVYRTRRAGAGAARALLTQDLIDDVRLIQHPILLGGGTPLFASDGTRRTLALVDTQRFASGATLQRYQVKERVQ
jgi:riboflavin biosynthesis pyrimidine reductase